MYHNRAMRKIPTLFVRDYDDGARVTNVVSTGAEANPEKLAENGIYRQGTPEYLDFPRTFDEIRSALAAMDIEGVVWHNQNGDMVKIKGSDFGLRRGVELVSA